MFWPPTCDLWISFIFKGGSASFSGMWLLAVACRICVVDLRRSSSLLSALGPLSLVLFRMWSMCACALFTGRGIPIFRLVLFRSSGIQTQESLVWFRFVNAIFKFCRLPWLTWTYCAHYFCVLCCSWCLFDIVINAVRNYFLVLWSTCARSTCADSTCADC